MSSVAENIQLAQSLFGPSECGFGAAGKGPQYENWKSLAHYILEWYYEPDLEALRMTYSIICAHFALPDKPAWFFLLGNSGTGKTALAIEPCGKLPRTHLLSQVSRNSFLSGYRGSDNSCKGILQRGDASSSMVWLFQDFTSIISGDYNEMKKLAGIFREVWDGHTSKDTGNLGKLDWTGRVTAIAAGTPAVERHWAAFRSLGERFITYRWRSTQNRQEAMRWVARQAPYRTQISKELCTRVTNLLDARWLSKLSKAQDFSNLPEAFFDKICILAELVSQLQTPVERDFKGKVRYVPDAEFPSRLIAAAQYLIKGHMVFMGRPLVGPPELKLAKKLLLDSIPVHRRAILDVLPLDGSPLNRNVLAKLTRVPKQSLYEEVEELAALDIIEISDAKAEPAICWSQSFLTLAERSGMFQKVQ